MADMAPALTGAAPEPSPHRLKLGPSSWKPVLNGGSRGSQERGARGSREELRRLRGRQKELGARARRLCRRLQVIQAKQVERHVRQQLSGLVGALSGGLPGAPHMELDRLASSSSARLRQAQGGFDSDATESSSGGDTDSGGEEEEEDGPGEEPPEPGCDGNGEWRWAVERAAIICRWTWLQAQVSDLEFRIRQQTEIYKQIRCTKGSVLLGDPLQSEEAASRALPGSSAVLNTRGSRLPSAVRAPSGENPRAAPSIAAPTPSPQSLEKQCSRLTQSENVACQNPPSAPVCASPGPQKTSRQVNGFLHCVRSSPSCNGSTEDLDPQDVLDKRRRLDVSSSPVVTDPSCVAARIRPLRAHKKRRLVRSCDVASLSRKPQKPLSARCGCQPPVTCILCGCKTYARSTHPSAMTLSERIALMDSSYHPILSFPYDTPLNLHFEALLKDERQFRLSHKTIKLCQLSKKPLERARRDCPSPASDLAGTGGSYGRNDQERLHLYRAESWQRNARLMPESAAERMKAQLRRTPPNHSGFLPYRLPSVQVSTPVTPRPHPALQQIPSYMETPPAASPSSSAVFKRKRLETSYDIDNIVIPMSMAAVARVEKIQYKEILTPRWRVLDSAERDAVVHDDPQLEDITDDGYLARHNTNEEIERSRWDSWTSAVPQRRGSRSSNKSDGRWTPQPPSCSQSSVQPASPDMGCHSLNDVPLSLSSAAADNPEPYSTVPSRSRVLSWSEDTRSSTPEVPDEEEQAVLPWEPRSFPLCDRDTRALLAMPLTPSRGRSKTPQDSPWPQASKPAAQTESIDFGMSMESLAPTSKEPPLPNSISVVRFRAHSGERIASLEYFPARPVTKR